MNRSHQNDSTNRLATLGVDTYSVSYEMTIDSPIHNVWNHMLNYHEWNPEHFGAKVERLGGDQNKEGEIILEYKKTDDGYAPPIVIETVKSIPNKQIVWAIYAPDSGASKGIGFVDFSLREVNKGTEFTYNCYGWQFASEGTNENNRRMLHQSALEQLGRILPALKAYVEKRK